MPGLYRVKFEKVAEITDEETKAILSLSEVVRDPEFYPCIDFDDEGQVAELRRILRPEVFEAIKTIGEEQGSFIIEA